MSDKFKALILDQKGEEFTREVKSIDKSFLKHGDVTVKVDYSDLNFKDGMILKNGGRLVKEFPHIPGIDFSGTVLESTNSRKTYNANSKCNNAIIRTKRCSSFNRCNPSVYDYERN